MRPETFSIKAEEQEFEDAFARVDPEVIESIRFSVENVRAFHEAQKPEEMWWKEMRPGLLPVIAMFR